MFMCSVVLLGVGGWFVVCGFSGGYVMVCRGGFLCFLVGGLCLFRYVI